MMLTGAVHRTSGTGGSFALGEGRGAGSNGTGAGAGAGLPGGAPQDALTNAAQHVNTLKLRNFHWENGGCTLIEK